MSKSPVSSQANLADASANLTKALATVEAAIDALEGLAIPPGPSGPAYPAGSEEAALDIAAALAELKLGKRT